MITNILYLISICSLSVLFSAIKKYRFESILPISSAYVIVVIYSFALIGHMQLGFIFALFSTVLFFAMGVIISIKNREIIRIALSSGLFVLLFVGYNIACHGMMVFSGDELAHWGAIVKSMIFTHELGTRNVTTLIASNYPPGVALLQYYFEDLFQTVNNGNLFSDWRMFLAYNLLLLSICIPVLSRLERIFYKDFFYSLRIDAFIGFASGCALCMVFLMEERDEEAELYIASVAVILVLTKVSGILFSSILIVSILVKKSFSYYKTCTDIQ